jgi:hypothetical protein
MARRHRADHRFDTDLRDDTDIERTTAERINDDLRIRRDAPDVLSPPAAPTNAALGLPEIDAQTAVYERLGRRFMTIRGGVSLVAVVTGVLVAIGAMVIFLAVAGGLLAVTGVIKSGATDSVVRATVLTGVGLVLAQFLAYLWGGYTAGRMARGAGAANGFLVPLLAILIAAGVGALVGYLGTSVHLNYSFQTVRLPIDRDLKIHLGIAVGAASVLAMFVGGIAGGVRGVWWHRKLEEPVLGPERTTDTDG